MAGLVTMFSQPLREVGSQIAKEGVQKTQGTWMKSMQDLANKYPMPEASRGEQLAQLKDLSIGGKIDILKFDQVQEIYPVPGGEKELYNYFKEGGEVEKALLQATDNQKIFAVEKSFFSMPDHITSEIIDRLANKGAAVETLLPDSQMQDLSNLDNSSHTQDILEVDKGEIIEKNRENGALREEAFKEELEKTYPEEQGYTSEREVYLRDESGQIAVDPITGEARRLDFVVINNDQVVNSYEVTSMTSDKTAQMAKESRIRDIGGNYIRINGNLIKFADDVTTELIRKD